MNHDPHVTEPTLYELWESAINQNEQLNEAAQAVQAEQQRFPPNLQLKVSISECALNEQDQLLFRN